MIFDINVEVVVVSCLQNVRIVSVKKEIMTLYGRVQTVVFCVMYLNDLLDLTYMFWILWPNVWFWFVKSPITKTLL